MSTITTYEGNIFVECEGSACSKVIKKVDKLLGKNRAFRIDKRYRGHNADIVINVENNSENEIKRVEKDLLEIQGVKKLRTELN